MYINFLTLITNILTGLCLLTLTACTSHYELETPCHEFGRFCSKSPINL